MNTTNTTNNTPTVGRATAHLLAALRFIENARAEVYEYNDALLGEDLATNLGKEYDPVFDTARDYVEKLLADQLRGWAICTDPNTEL